MATEVLVSESQRERVLHAASDLFAERGFDDVTMAEIAAAAGVARATVFNYFGSKHAIVESITETVLDSYRGMLDDALADETAPTGDLVRSLFVDMGAGIEQQRGFFRGVFREIARIQLGLDEGVLAQQINEEVRVRLLRLVERGQARGELNGGLRAEAVTDAFHSLVNGTITGWLYTDDTAPLTERMRAAADVFLSPVEVTPPPRPRRRTPSKETKR